MRHRTVGAGATAATRVAITGTNGKSTTTALIADDGTRAERLAGHIAYWFAFNNFLEGKPLAGG